jgi:hypothetical protein
MPQAMVLIEANLQLKCTEPTVAEGLEYGFYVAVKSMGHNAEYIWTSEPSYQKGWELLHYEPCLLLQDMSIPFF